MTTPTPQPEQSAPAKAVTPHGPRQVDLGREDNLVPWSVWFARSSAAVRQFHGVQEGQRPVFRVTLVDGRTFAITHVQTHVSRGRCFVGTNRWGETDAICDVITGYSLVGTGPDARPMALTVPPANIASVECVLVRELPKQQVEQHEQSHEENQPFGFAAWKNWDGELKLEEVEEKVEELTPEQSP